MADPIDFTDPCAVYRALRKAKAELLLGTREVRIRFRNGDDEQEVQFAQPKAEDLDHAIAEYPGLCEAEGGDVGTQVRRFAIRFGGGPRRNGRRGY